MTFSTANQELQDASQHSYYDSGLEESETPSSKSSSGPRIGPLALPEDHYERTTPDGSIGETEHPENGKAGAPPPPPAPTPPAAPSITGNTAGSHARRHLITHTPSETRRVSGNVGGVFLISLPTIPGAAARTSVKEACDLTAAQHNQYAT